MDDIEVNDELKVNEPVRKYKPSERYTYADYASWDDDNRYELIDGEVFVMSAPSTEHQRVLRRLLVLLDTFLKGKKCEVFIAPFDVCLFGKGDEDDTVVQPDILVICDKSILDKKRCNGTPDMVIEIISPSTSRLDRIKKLNKYLQAGVREYWIVDPEDKSVAVHILERGKYIIGAFERDETISVHILEGCEIDLSDVFSADEE